MGRGAGRLIVSAAGICMCLSAAHGQAIDDRFASGFFLPDGFSLFSTAAVSPATSSAAQSVPLPRPAPWRPVGDVAQEPGFELRGGQEPLAYAATEPSTSDGFSLWLSSAPEREGFNELGSMLLATRPSVSGNSFISKPLAGDTATRLAARAPLAPIGSDLASMIARKAEEHGVPSALADAVVRVESNYQPRVSGKGGALGLMQIKYTTAKAIGFTGTQQELFDPATNLEWGMRYLSGAHKLAKGDTCGTVMRYQGGHRTARMSKDATVYCNKVQAILARGGQTPAQAKSLARASTKSKVAVSDQTAARKKTRSASAGPLVLTSQ